jgi:hypothetical protein
VILKTINTRLNKLLFWILRIVYPMRYNTSNRRSLPIKTVRASVDSTYTNLTQPTGIGGGLGWYVLYQPSCALVGFHRGFLIHKAGA